MFAGDHDIDETVGVTDLGDSNAGTENTYQKTHSMKRMFFEYVEDLTKELESVEQSLSETSCRPIHLLEVFCHGQSELTKQAQNLGYRAQRFGLEQGDLSTCEGRKAMFEVLVNHKPKHVWYSPTCGPWSSWSNLNEAMSLEACRRVQKDREDNLYQLALGIVILRKTREIGSHFHWEQPQKGHMFKCPFMNELHENTYCASFDMCNVGQLRDPVSKLLMKKGTEVCTTSMRFFQAVHGRLCLRNHEHQEIAGSTHTGHGTVLRSRFSERYTRKFARFVAKTLLKIKTCKEPVKPSMFAEICANSTEANGRMSKRPRVAPQAKAIRKRAEEATVDTEQKRRRIEGKTPPENLIEEISENLSKIFEECLRQAPRVGKKEITDNQLCSKLEGVFVDKKIHKIMIYKGIDRAQPPPKDLFKNEAPLRRNIYVRRSDGKLVMDPKWESWSHLSKRQQCKHVVPARVCITLYASNPNPPDACPPEERLEIENSRSAVQEMSSASDMKHDEKPKEVEHPKILDTSSMKADMTSENHGPRFLQLSREERTMLVRMHKNLGHPSPSQMYQVLKQSQVAPRIAQGALDMQCSVCQSSKRPRIARPANLKAELDFNDRIGMDGMEFTNSKGKVFHCYHILDYGTSFQVARAAPNRSADEVIENVSLSWFNWAGPPVEMVTDSATEFTSEKFGDFLQQNNVKAITIAPEAHWQLGKVERHGQTLQNMLTKFDTEHPIEGYNEFQQALNHCCAAKNSLSLRKGYSPDILVFGKAIRLPGSITSDEQLPSHMLADEETARGISFRQQLACRETARKAFHESDNDQAMRRAILRRSRPTREMYSPGEWVMCWKKIGNHASWIGPAKVIQHFDQNNIWCELTGRLFKIAPEMTRPVTSLESQRIPSWTPESETKPSPARTSNPEAEEEERTAEEDTTVQTTPEERTNQDTESRRSSHTSSEQPDLEPEASMSPRQEIDPANIPVPSTDEEDELVCDHILCMDVDPEIHAGVPEMKDACWRAEYCVEQSDIDQWRKESNPRELAFLVTNAKKQRTEVKMSQLTAEEKLKFQEAKKAEISNWLKTGTVSKILRNQLREDQILRCRWILVWKPVEPSTDADRNQPTKYKPKARLVVLGYMDPELESIPRDSPTLGRQSRMLILQMIASNRWSVKSFDIKSAFLQGTRGDRLLGLEPVDELKEAMGLKSNEICKLDKSAYGLIDAPFLWFKSLDASLKELGFIAAPFDPCVYLLWNPEAKTPSGILGVHVDDGICGGDEFFDRQIKLLEQKYPFGSKQMTNFTFTGVEIAQKPDMSIELSQSKYVSNIESIPIDTNRRKGLEEPVTPKEQHNLRALVGSLQYAAVNTRPDLSSRLSYLQSEINKATVQTLLDANRILHEAKRHKDTTIKIQPINPEEFRFLVFSDASFSSPKIPDSHSGMIILGTHKGINDNYSCPISPLTWGCKKIQKVVVSTLSAETISLNTALDQLSWLRLYWAWLWNPKVNWRNPKAALQNAPDVTSSSTHLAQQLPASVAVTDCKSLFDLVSRTAQPNCAEFRTQLLAKSIQELLQEGINLRWVHTGAQLADALTKIMNSHFLRETLRIGRYQLHDELQVLKERANAKGRIEWLQQDVLSKERKSSHLLGV